MIDRGRLRALLERERAAFVQRNPRSRDAYRRAAGSLLGNVPMTWMNKAAGGFPVYLAEASGATVVDVDGHRYVDFSLGDTGAMAGHSPAPTVQAVQRRLLEAGGAPVGVAAARVPLPERGALALQQRGQPPAVDHGVRRAPPPR